MLGKGKTDLAIVQKVALDYFADVMKEEGGKNIFRSIKVILNLYPEEVHVITNNKAITSFRDLEGKKVSVGAENSGSLLIGMLDRREEKYIAMMGRLVLAILSNKGKLESSGHPKWKKSLLRYTYGDVGYPPANDIIRIYNILDEFGYKIINK